MLGLVVVKKVDHPPPPHQIWFAKNKVFQNCFLFLNWCWSTPKIIKFFKVVKWDFDLHLIHKHSVGIITFPIHFPNLNIHLEYFFFLSVYWNFFWFMNIICYSTNTLDYLYCVMFVKSSSQFLQHILMVNISNPDFKLPKFVLCNKNFDSWLKMCGVRCRCDVIPIELRNTGFPQLHWHLKKIDHSCSRLQNAWILFKTGKTWICHEI